MWVPGTLDVFFNMLAASMTWTKKRGGPWVPTPMDMVHRMLELAEVGPQDCVYDLGCGDARLVITAARDYGARAVGIEIDPMRYIWCQLMITAFGLRRRVRIRYGNFFRKDLSAATVVTSYLLEDTNNKLVSKFREELQPGTRVVSNNFKFRDLPEVAKDGNARLYKIDC